MRGHARFSGLSGRKYPLAFSVGRDPTRTFQPERCSRPPRTARASANTSSNASPWVYPEMDLVGCRYRRTAGGFPGPWTVADHREFHSGYDTPNRTPAAMRTCGCPTACEAWPPVYLRQGRRTTSARRQNMAASSSTRSNNQPASRRDGNTGAPTPPPAP